MKTEINDVMKLKFGDIIWVISGGKVYEYSFTYKDSITIYFDKLKAAVLTLAGYEYLFKDVFLNRESAIEEALKRAAEIMSKYSQHQKNNFVQGKTQ
jgi:hypothetical protein